MGFTFLQLRYVSYFRYVAAVMGPGRAYDYMASPEKLNEPY